MGTEEDATATAMFSIHSVLKNPQRKMCSAISTNLCSVRTASDVGLIWSDVYSCLGIGSSAPLVRDRYPWATSSAHDKYSGGKRNKAGLLVNPTAD